MSFSIDLLEHASRLLGIEEDVVSNSRNVDVRRAVSAGYYALFHRLSEAAVEQIASLAPRKTANRIHRWLNHSDLKKVDVEFAALPLTQSLRGLLDGKVSEEMKAIAINLIRLQEPRLYADYDLDFSPTWYGARSIVESPVEAIDAWEEIRQTAEANLFALSLFFWKNWDKERWSKTALRPRIGIILGSGLGEFAGRVGEGVAVPYEEIPHFPQSTVQGHSGRLVVGTLQGVDVAVMQGRVHAYEGYSMEQVTFPTRVLKLFGVETLIVTNAAGGIDPRYGQGAIVGICDHINLTGTNACLGPNDERFGPRFHDMSSAYSPRLLKLASDAAQQLQWTLNTGVYLAVLGPSFETPAEIRAFRVLGADLVGMSTVHEVIVARHMGVEILGLSLVTNMAAGVIEQVIDHEETMAVGRAASAQFSALLTAIIPRIATLGTV